MCEHYRDSMGLLGSDHVLKPAEILLQPLVCGKLVGNCESPGVIGVYDKQRQLSASRYRASSRTKTPEQLGIPKIAPGSMVFSCVSTHDSAPPPRSKSPSKCFVGMVFGPSGRFDIMRVIWQATHDNTRETWLQDNAVAGPVVILHTDAR